jgi:transcription initiation factor IIE alpha subunit
MLAKYSFQFSFAEILKLIFYKKVCPTCNNELEKKKDKIFIKEGWHDLGSNHYTYGKEYQLKWYFFCPHCNKKVEYKELNQRIF